MLTIIREATVLDIESWSQMRTALWPETTDAHLSEIKDYFNAQSSDIEKVFLICFDSNVVGFTELNIRNFAEGSRKDKVPYVEGWYIKPEFQNQEFGKQLITHAENWAKSLGYDELASDTEIDNIKSIAIHKDMGFEETERIVCLLKKL